MWNVCNLDKNGDPLPVAPFLPTAPTTRWVPNINGVDQYGNTGSLIYSGDFFVKFKVDLPSTPVASNQSFVGGSGGGSPNAGAFTLFIQSNSIISLQLPTTSGMRYDLGYNAPSMLGQTVEIEVSRASGVLSLIIDGTTVDTFDSNPFGVVDVEVANIGRWSTELYYQGIIYNYTDSLGNNFPMDDSWANNPTMRNTGTGADGVFVNPTEPMWEQIPA